MKEFAPLEEFAIGGNSFNGSKFFHRKRKEFALIGANSFFYDLTVFWKGFVIRESKMEVTKKFPFVI